MNIPRFAGLHLAMVFAFGPTTTKADPPVPGVNDTPEARAKYMRITGESYAVTVGEKGIAKFLAEPVLRFTNPVSGVVDGGLFIWQDANKRPIAAAQIFIVPNTEKLWLHEFQSLSTERLKFDHSGKTVWAPNTAGVNFESISNVREPAEKPEARLTQMRQIARRFSVKDDFEGADADELRLMAAPLIRYSSDNLLDGALFAYAHGTDPELLLLIEAQRPAPDRTETPKQTKPTWRVALAPMTSYAITAKLDGKDFWSVKWRQSPHPVDATFKNFVFPPNSQ